MGNIAGDARPSASGEIVKTAVNGAATMKTCWRRAARGALAPKSVTDAAAALHPPGSGSREYRHAAAQPRGILWCRLARRMPLCRASGQPSLGRHRRAAPRALAGTREGDPVAAVGVGVAAGVRFVGAASAARARRRERHAQRQEARLQLAALPAGFVSG